jgi:hypothetical protein
VGERGVGVTCGTYAEAGDEYFDSGGFTVRRHC